MEFLNHFKIIESIIAFIVAFFVRLIITKSLRKIQTKFGFQNSRILVTNKIITVIIYITVIVVVAFIWGVDEKQLLIYISSFLTVLGIAFFVTQRTPEKNWLLCQILLFFKIILCILPNKNKLPF